MHRTVCILYWSDQLFSFIEITISREITQRAPGIQHHVEIVLNHKIEGLEESRSDHRCDIQLAEAEHLKSVLPHSIDSRFQSRIVVDPVSVIDHRLDGAQDRLINVEDEQSLFLSERIFSWSVNHKWVVILFGVIWSCSFGFRATMSCKDSKSTPCSNSTNA